PHMISPCGGSPGTCFCYCRVPTRGGVVSVPGPMQGKCFFGCGNWTPAMGPVCPYFVWTN
uniref:Zinc finger GRF-type domain-containing protein n=2 Tax=Triticinae TaxID=1648030 RepID=A0A453EKZ5_AEGTS